LFFHSFIKHSFSKGFDLNQLWILTKSEFTNSNYPEPIHTSNNKPSSNSHKFEDIKTLVQHKIRITFRPTREEEKTA